MIDDDTVLGDTQAAPPAAAPIARGSAGLIALDMRTSVLPRAHGQAIRPSGEARFEPMRVIGRGGLGEVTLARDHDIDRPVAIKRLRGEPSEDQLMRFAHEVRIVGQLEHPNITPVYDVGVDDDGQHYFVMRYVEGQTLEMLIAQLASGDPELLREYTFERRVELFLSVLHALQYAHAKGIVHRDIKPANIMIGPFGEVMLMDWGIAKRADTELPELPESGEPTDPKARVTSTRAGALVGTPLYMSPEQAMCKTDQIDVRSDIYSLCVVFYELLTLEHYLLAQVKNVPELLHAIAEGEHVKACYVRNDLQTPVPAELSWFIEKGLAKDPAQRYQTIGEMIDAMTILKAGRFPVQCGVTGMKRVGNHAIRFVDKDFKGAVAIMGAIAVLALLGVISIVRWIV